jgi:urease accessory protein
LNLRLLQLADSALPIGGYMHSWGLEAAVTRRLVSDAPTLEQWTRDWLRHSFAPLEGVLVGEVWRATQSQSWSDVRRAGEILTASLAPPSIRRASLQMGEQLASLGSTWGWSSAGIGHLEREVAAAHRHHAIVFGLLAGLSGADERSGLVSYLHHAAVGMISAGVRSIPVGHTHGQQILSYLHDDLTRIASDLCGRDAETAGAGCPFYEVLCDEQVRLDTRLFRS